MALHQKKLNRKRDSNANSRPLSTPIHDPELPGTTMRLTADGDIGFFDMECLQKALAKRFGVHRRFIQVRMERYGLIEVVAQNVWKNNN